MVPRKKVKSNGWDGLYVLVDELTNYRMELGASLRNYDGDSATLRGGKAPLKATSVGSIYVTEKGFRGTRSYYPAAFNLRWLKIK